jgi:putative PIN family toxin of toxin-antitoxin system
MSVRAVYDCMIFLQAASNPQRVHSTFRLVQSGEVTLFVSAEILAEIRDVLTRPKHTQKFPALNAENVSRFLFELVNTSTLIDQVPDAFIVSRDPKDSKYVNLAIAASAQFLVSWDPHLLALMNEQTFEGSQFRRQYPSLQILDPVRFIQMVAPTSSP